MAADPQLDQARAALAREPDSLDLTFELLGLLQDTFERDGGFALVDEMVRLARAAARLPVTDAEDRALVLLALAESLGVHGAHTSNAAEVAEGLAAATEAVAIAPPELRPAALNVRGALLGRTFQRTRDPTLLPELLTTLRAAVAQTDPDDPEGWRTRANLASALVDAYTATGDRALIDEALAIQRELDADPDLPVPELLAAQLGSALNNLYAQTMQVEVLRDGIDVLRRAVAGPGVPQRQYGRVALATLGGMLTMLGERVPAERAALREGLALCRRAAEGITHDDGDYQVVVGNLAMALGRVFRIEGDQLALDESVRLFAESMDDPRFGRLAEMQDFAALAYTRQFVATGAVGALRQAVHLLRRSLLRPDHGLAIRAGRLSVALMRLAAATGRRRYLAEAARVGRLGARWPDSPPPARLLAAEAWLAACLARGRRRPAGAAAEAAVALLPSAAGVRLGWEDRLFHLGAAAPLACDVVAAQLALRRPARAVELVEAARGTLLADTIDPAGELARLRAADAELAARIDEIRERLRSARDPRALADEFEALVARARGIDGFAGFFAPPELAELCQQAGEGPIVVVNAHPTRSDAIIIEPTGVRVVPLPALDPVQAAAHADRLAAPHPGLGVTAASLEWLWATVTGPVLAALPAGGRVWWCPVGVMSRLPLHAAGTATTSALDVVVSSYTPTVRALAHARRAWPVGPVDTLIVSVPRAPGMRALPEVDEEVATIARLVASATVVAGASATRSQVLAHLPAHALVHFACHGVPDDLDPAHGSLALSDHDRQPFTVADIAALNLGAAGLAYLSACDTSGTNDALREESVHLVGACQLAGFRAVIGSLWSVSDRGAKEVATHFYEILTAGGSRPPAIAESAVALNAAARLMRQTYPRSPELWCAHVHVGA